MSEMKMILLSDEEFCFPQDDIATVDVVFAVMIGLFGSVISTSNKLKLLLHEIHSDASLKKPKTLLGMLLGHVGDVIDKTTRGGKPFATYMHRLFGGHDIFFYRSRRQSICTFMQAVWNSQRNSTDYKAFDRRHIFQKRRRATGELLS